MGIVRSEIFDTSAKLRADNADDVAVRSAEVPRDSLECLAESLRYTLEVRRSSSNVNLRKWKDGSGFSLSLKRTGSVVDMKLERPVHREIVDDLLRRPRFALRKRRPMSSLSAKDLSNK